MVQMLERRSRTLKGPLCLSSDTYIDVYMYFQARPFTVPRAVLRSRASRRIRVMAQPKYVTKKYDPAAAPPPYPRIHPKTLAARSTKRIVDLALPKRRVLLETMKLAATKNMKATVSDLLVKVRKSRYQRYRVFCNRRQEREARKKRKRMAKLRRALTKPEEWQRHMRVLERLAAPKVAAKPKRRKPAKRKKWRPIDLERIYLMASPIVRRVPKLKEPLEVPRRALIYRITKRIEILATRKKRPEIPLRIPGAVSPAAAKAIASERITALAKPAQRPTGRETDLREDAFTVSPMALKASCSKRLKRLAKPKTYPKPKFKRLRTALLKR
ncbi:PREDICTED: testicular haploid expressed gene protein-like isoform X2 [Wasmannia auropunctata]|uniref:testicular haploid expressed gene protein-like isoform X2 n=1 Tax=Wasmannia auropunctata TaxID=64793 RepID=UPI0005EE85C8|nr:PREDICTED: testicular haploid expressed gene protein-like isoform X2 [Wasmannia auropunctata]XP_011695250.1 PREDICTED: testicular haploid expressed gene protein-like isoform X2 [Wasmannia auropunctata]